MNVAKYDGNIHGMFVASVVTKRFVLTLSKKKLHQHQNLHLHPQWAGEWSIQMEHSKIHTYRVASFKLRVEKDNIDL